MDDNNSKADIERIRREVLEVLRHLQHAPGVQMQEVPPDFRVPRWVPRWGWRGWRGAGGVLPTWRGAEGGGWRCGGAPRGPRTAPWRGLSVR
jgi:hypothetical protein